MLVACAYAGSARARREKSHKAPGVVHVVVTVVSSVMLMNEKHTETKYMYVLNS